MGGKVPDDVQRFLLSGSFTVPHVEAILQLRADPGPWDAERLAARLYVRVRSASELLVDLLAAGIITSQPDAPPSFLYRPTEELAQLLDRLAETYSSQLVAVTRLIHRTEQRKAQDFADAFRLRKDT